MFNALFVLVVFLLQLNKDQIHVKWPLGVRTNITYIEETSEVFTGLIFCLVFWIVDTNESLWYGTYSMNCVHDTYDIDMAKIKKDYEA